MSPVTSLHPDRARKQTDDVAQALQDLRGRLYDHQAAESVRATVAHARKPFDGDAFLALISNHPVFPRMHLITEDE